MWGSAKEAARRASTAASKLAHRASTLLQSATKDDLSRAEELYTRLKKITEGTTCLDKPGEIDRLIAKFRAKQSSAGVVWHEGIVIRVAYIYFLHNAFNPLKAKILVTQNSYIDKLRAQNPT